MTYPNHKFKTHRIQVIDSWLFAICLEFTFVSKHCFDRSCPHKFHLFTEKAVIFNLKTALDGTEKLPLSNFLFLSSFTSAVSEQLSKQLRSLKSQNVLQEHVIHADTSVMNSENSVMFHFCHTVLFVIIN